MSVPLRRTADATTRHSGVTVRDHFAAEGVREALSQLDDPDLRDLRVLELGCGTSRLPFIIASSGHRVLAADADSGALACLAERLVPTTPRHTEVASRVELRLADMQSFSFFPERFKAVCLPATRLAVLEPDERRAVLGRAAGHLAPGGLLIVCTRDVRHTPNAFALAEERSRSRRNAANTYRAPSVREAGLDVDAEIGGTRARTVGSARIADTCANLGLTVTFQRSRPDPAEPGQMHVTLAALRS